MKDFIIYPNPDIEMRLIVQVVKRIVLILTFIHED